MAFPFKDYTNTGGDMLCEDCIHCDLFILGRELACTCGKDGKVYFEVGICNQFEGVNHGKQ